MGKYTISIYDMATEKVEKTLERNIISVSLYIKYQTIAEKLKDKAIKTDQEMFNALEDVMLETFDGLTHDDYQTKVDVAEVLNVYGSILKKATLISSKNICSLYDGHNNDNKR